MPEARALRRSTINFAAAVAEVMLAALLVAVVFAAALLAARALDAASA